MFGTSDTPIRDILANPPAGLEVGPDDEVIGNSPKPYVQRCPECGKLVDLNDGPAALEHIKSHPKAAQEAAARVAMEDLCSTGILRRVGG